MDKRLNVIFSLACFICFFFILWGCERQAEPPQKSKTVTKKIVVAKKETSKPQTPNKIEVSKPDSQKAPVKPEPKIALKIVDDKPDVSDKTEVASVPTTTQRVKKFETTGSYNPLGKLDPFAPLFQAKRISTTVKKKTGARRIPRTPLEKVSLSQLKLVAVILSKSGNKALVKEASGKGYIIKKGAFIGLRSGKIVEILKDRIIVEEETEDIYGKISVSKRTLQLQKPPGE